MFNGTIQFIYSLSIATLNFQRVHIDTIIEDAMYTLYIHYILQFCRSLCLLTSKVVGLTDDEAESLCEVRVLGT